MAASLATREALWLRHLFEELGTLLIEPTPLFIDNRSAIEFTKNSNFHAQSKHIDIQHHFVWEKVDSNEIEIIHCASEENRADIFTKALPAPAHRRSLELLNMDIEFRGSVVAGNSTSRKGGAE